MVSAVCRSLLAALLSAALLSGPSVAAAQETLTPGQVLQKLFPRVEPKKPRKTATARKPADQKTQDRAAAGEAAAPAPTAPIPEPKPKQSMATAAATAPEPAVAAAAPDDVEAPKAAATTEAATTEIAAAPTAPPSVPEPARGETDGSEALRAAGTLQPELGMEALAFATSSIQPATRPVSPGVPLPEPKPREYAALPPDEAGEAGAPEPADPAPDALAAVEGDAPPLPRTKPEVQMAAMIMPRAPLVPEKLSACSAGLAALKIAAKPLPAVSDGACGAPDPFQVTAIGDGSIALEPAATINCETATSLSAWLTGDVQAAATAAYGSRVTAVRVLDSYSCRGRNQVVGAPLSEHAFMNAIDIGAFEIGGRWVTVEKGKDHTDKDTDFIQSVRLAACQRFLTVLGPGSDGYHENHLHLDMRHRGKHGDSVYCH